MGNELNRGVYSSIIPPPPWGGGKESKGLRAREENQRRVEKMERQKRREKFPWVIRENQCFHFPK
jgi:hypothetical protein